MSKEKINKTIPITTIDDFIVSELVITDKGNMIIDYRPPYKKIKKERVSE